MKKFKVPVLPSTSIKSVRFPNEIIEEVEQIIQSKTNSGYSCTFSAFVNEAVKIAIEQVKEEENHSES